MEPVPPRLPQRPPPIRIPSSSSNSSSSSQPQLRSAQNYQPLFAGGQDGKGLRYAFDMELCGTNAAAAAASAGVDGGSRGSGSERFPLPPPLPKEPRKVLNSVEVRI